MLLLEKIKNYILLIYKYVIKGFLFFFIISFGFWLIIFSRKEVEGQYTIPIKYINLPNDTQYKTTPPKEISITIVDKGNNILQFDFFKPDTIIVDISKFLDTNENEIQPEELIKQRLSHSAILKSQSPRLISLDLLKLSQKTVSIIFEGDIKTRNKDIVLDSTYTNPDKINIYGSTKRLNMISNIKSIYTNFADISSSGKHILKLDIPKDINADLESVDLNILVKKYGESTLKIPITCKNAPANVTVKFFPSTASIIFSSPEKNLNKITQDNFKIDFDYNYLTTLNNKNILDLKITKKPNSSIISKIDPSMVEFLIDKK